MMSTIRLLVGSLVGVVLAACNTSSDAAVTTTAPVMKATSQPAAVPPPPAALPPAAPTPTTNPACAQCERERVACLGAIARGQLPEGSEQFADPVNSAKQMCAIDAMGCFTEANCPRK